MQYYLFLLLLGGNNVTFVGEFLKSLIPELYFHLVSTVSYATESARWVPHPLQLGIRCVEILEYAAGNELKYHVDSNSIYTLMVIKILLFIISMVIIIMVTTVILLL